MSQNITRDDYQRLADKYESDKEVMEFVLLTYHGTRVTYLLKGFKLGVTVGLLVATILSLVVYLAN